MNFSGRAAFRHILPALCLLVCAFFLLPGGARAQAINAQAPIHISNRYDPTQPLFTIEQSSISSADAQEWLDTTGVKQTWIDAGGVLHCAGGCTGSGVTLQTNGVNNASQSLLNLVAGSNITLTNTGGNVTISSSGSGSGLPSTWNVTAANAVTAAPVAGQDVTTFTVLQSTAGSPTANIWQVCTNNAGACGTVLAWVNASGGFGFAGNNLQLGGSGQSTQSKFLAYGGSTPNAGFDIEALDSTGAIRADLYFDPTVAGRACIVSSSISGACPAANVINVGPQSGAVLLAPSATQQILAGSASVVPLQIAGAASQTADLFDVCTNATCATKRLSIAPNGVLNADYISASSAVTAAGGFVLTGTGAHYQTNNAASDASGTISISSSTSGSHTFSAAYSSAPVCVVTQQGLSASPTVYFGVSASTTTLTVYASTSGTYTVGYLCMGNPS
ncbi:MAG: hypothetical protein ACRD3D_13155 [Terriglobia bacterium]